MEPVLPETKVTITDVGQGSAALIESGGEYALIDTGFAERAQSISPKQWLYIPMQAAFSVRNI